MGFGPKGWTMPPRRCHPHRPIRESLQIPEGWGGCQRAGTGGPAPGCRDQTCSWWCGYICLWWALWMGNRGGIPSGGLPQALPTMQGTFPALCQSLLQEGRSADRSKRSKRSLPPPPSIVPIPRLKSINKKGSASRRDHISIKNIKNQYTHLSDPPTQGAQHCEPPEVGLAHIYIPPPPIHNNTAAGVQLVPPVTPSQEASYKPSRGTGGWHTAGTGG